MQRARAVTKSDAANLPDGVCQGLYVTGAGDVNVVLADDADAAAMVIAVAAKSLLLGLNIKKVMSTSTTATGIFALYRN